MPQALLIELSHNALIGVSGDDARAFLHGQFTNDVEKLEVGGAQWNGWCTAKGRLLATFLLVRQADRYLMLLPADIAEPVRKRLALFVLRSKVKLEDMSAQLARFGLVGEGAEAALVHAFGAAPQPMQGVATAGALCMRLDARRFVILAPQANAGGVRELLESATTPAGTEAWDLAAIHAGIPAIVAATQEAFVPQMVNLELIGGVNFKKGCYPGQEIVARMHYRGGLKRRMAMAHVAGAEAPSAGDSLYAAAFGEQAAGEVVNVAASPGGGFDVLVVAQLESLSARDLRWKSPGGPALELRELPYPLPAPAA